MALNVFELFAKLGLDTSDYESGLAGAESLGSRFGSGIQTAARVGATALIGASTAAVGFAASSVRAGADFDSAMSQVAATMGTTTDQIQDLRDFAQEMGSTTAFSATQAADALNYMALAGYDAETSMQMLPNVLNLAAAGSIDLARASDMITDAQSALGLELPETAAMVDQMARAASMSNTSVEQLGDAILTLGATGANVAGGTNELATILGVLADNGIKGAEGGTHLRNMILSLTNPTSQAADAIAELGINVYDQEGNMRSMVDIIYDLQQSLEGMTAQEQDSFIGTIFNRADMASINALLNTQIERYDAISDALDEAAGSAQQMADTQLDNLTGDVTLFRSALEGAKIAVSDALTPTLRQFVEMGTEGLSAVTQAFQEGGLEGAMSALGEWLSDALTSIVEMTPDIIRAGGTLLSALGRALVDNAPLIMESTLEVAQYLIDSFSEAVNGDGATGFFDMTMQLFEMLGGFLVENIPVLMSTTAELISQLVTYFTAPENQAMIFDLGLSIIEAIADGLVQATPTIIAMIPEIISNNIMAIEEEFPRLLEAVGTLLGDLGQIVIGLIGGLMGQSYDEVVGNVAAVWDFLTSSFNNFITGVQTFFSSIWDSVKSFFDPLVSFISPVLEAVDYLFDTVFTAIGIVVGNTMDSIFSTIDEVWNGIVNFLDNTILTPLQDMFDTAFNAMYDLVEQPLNNIKNLVEEVFSWISDFIGGIVSGAAEWGADLIDNFVSGITAARDTLTSGISGAADTIRSYIGFSEPEVGPLSNFHTFAPDMIDLFAQGIDDSMSTLEDSLINMGDTVAESMPTMSADRIASNGVITVAGNGNVDTRPIVIPVYIGNEKIDELVVDSNQRTAFISGGRA